MRARIFGGVIAMLPQSKQNVAFLYFLSVGAVPAQFTRLRQQDGKVADTFFNMQDMSIYQATDGLASFGY